MYEPRDPLPPGHGEPRSLNPRGTFDTDPGVQFRCPECGVMVQNLRPDAHGEWEGYCPSHGTVPAVALGSQTDNDDEDQDE